MKLCSDGDRAARLAQQRESLPQHMVASPVTVAEVIAGVPCRIDAFLELGRP
jgi:hypothetical protein